jgi:trimethyllysine dioxygenase
LNLVVTTIDSLEPTARMLVVRWSDGVTSEYPWIWLRDHDVATLHPVTQQRELFTAGVDRGISSDHVEIADGHIDVTWSNADQPSRVEVELLDRFREAAPARVDVAAERVNWDAETIAEEWPTVEHESVMTTDDGVAAWMRKVATYGFCIVVGTPPTIEATETLLRRVGYVRETIFGGFWNFQADLSKADTAYTNIELLPHTDGTYSHDAPGLQLLHCLEFDGEGGESTMVDGFRVASEMRTAHPDEYATLSRVEVPGQYVGDGVHLMASRPVFRTDAAGDLVQVSYNNADRAPFLLPATEMDAFYHAVRVLESLLNDHRLQWRRANPPGDAMLFDNWRVLHGRTAYTGHRHLCGGYVNREDYESRLRLALS